MNPIDRPPESAVFQRAGQMQVRVTQPSSPWNLALGLAFCVVLGVIVFASLSNGRQARAEIARPAARAPARAPALTTASAPSVVSVQPRTGPAVALPLPGPLLDDPARRWRSPAMVVDLSEPAGAAHPAAQPQIGPVQTPDEVGPSAEERFAARVTTGGVETAHATRLHNPALVAPQGTVIPAVLETAIDSDLPGSVRAVVSQDVRGFDGTTILIPRGSKLIGQYRNGVAQGQSRAFVIWSRILTPDGVSVDVGSPATDPLGRGGLEGETDSHFFARFGGAILLTVMNAGVEAVGRRSGTSTAIIIGQPGQSGVSGVAPQPRDIPVTVKVAQGTPLQVFVTRDLDFSGVTAKR